ncbi:MAG: hypothetical protein KDI79_31890 [Anaerolineae bacterium]|nr:hypothetical protein [Anaerolineae bacterium]
MTISPHPTLAEWLAYLDRMGKSASTNRNYGRTILLTCGAIRFWANGLQPLAADQLIA